MGLIKEPNNVDFTVLDKTWTDKEKKEFSAFIKKRKLRYKRRIGKRLSNKQETIK